MRNIQYPPWECPTVPGAERSYFPEGDAEAQRSWCCICFLQRDSAQTWQGLWGRARAEGKSAGAVSPSDAAWDVAFIVGAGRQSGVRWLSDPSTLSSSVGRERKAGGALLPSSFSLGGFSFLLVTVLIQFISTTTHKDFPGSGEVTAGYIRAALGEDPESIGEVTALHGIIL